MNLQQTFELVSQELKAQQVVKEIPTLRLTNAKGYYGNISKFRSSINQAEYFRFISLSKVSFQERMFNNLRELKEKLIETICHEFAHMTFWNHSKEHKALTAHYVQLIKNSSVYCTLIPEYMYEEIPPKEDPKPTPKKEEKKPAEKKEDPKPEPKKEEHPVNYKKVVTELEGIKTETYTGEKWSYSRSTKNNSFKKAILIINETEVKLASPSKKNAAAAIQEALKITVNFK